MNSWWQVLRFGASAARSALIQGRVLNCLWELTYRCNAKCAICGYWRIPAEPARELTLAQIQEGLAKVYAYGCRLINFTGGEPTLRRDLEDIIHSAARLGIWTSLVTNGSLLTRQRLRHFKHAGLDHLLISLDSTDPGVHDGHRRIPGLHARVQDCLRWLGEDFLSQHRTGGVMCAVSVANLGQVCDLVALARQRGVYAVLQPYHSNKTGDSALGAPIGDEVVQQLLALNRPDRTLLNSTMYLRGMARFCQGERLPRCSAGRKYFSVDPYGYLHPCVDTPAAGHLLRDEMSVIRSDQALRTVAACAGCWYCFRGEADSALTVRGYFEKVRLGLAVIGRNRSRARGSSAAQLRPDPAVRPSLQGRGSGSA